MLITKICGNIYHDNNLQYEQYAIDYIDLEWYELHKRVIRKTSLANVEFGIQLPANTKFLQDGDILLILDKTVFVVRVKQCECIAITPKTNYELAKICYEIGNRHAPLFIDEDNDQCLLLPKDKPIQLMLEKLGFNVAILNARLTKPLNSFTAKDTHGHSH